MKPYIFFSSDKYKKEASPFFILIIIMANHLPHITSNMYERGSANQILHYPIWIGDHIMADNEEWLRTHHINYILDIGSGNPDTFPFVSYKKIDIDDNENAPISDHFDSCIEFIDSALMYGTGLLIHCYAGISRSSTVLIAWLIHRFFDRNPALFRNQDTICSSATFCRVEDFILFVKSHRPIICPNPGFLSQLRIFFMTEQMNFMFGKK